MIKCKRTSPDWVSHKRISRIMRKRIKKSTLLGTSLKTSSMPEIAVQCTLAVATIEMIGKPFIDCDKCYERNHDCKEEENAIWS